MKHYLILFRFIFFLFVYLAFNDLNAQDPERPISNNIDLWTFDSKGGFYGIENNRCGRSTIFYYDSLFNLKWIYADSLNGYIYKHIYLNKFENEIIIEGYRQVADDVGGARAYNIFKLDTSGNLIKSIDWNPSEKYQYFPGSSGFDIGNDSVIYFGFQSENRKDFRLFVLNFSLIIMDSSTVLDHPYTDLLYSNKLGLLLQDASYWGTLNDSVHFAFEGISAYHQPFDSDDSIAWFHSYQGITSFNKNTGEVQRKDLSDIFSSIQRIQPHDSIISILGTIKDNDRPYYTNISKKIWQQVSPSIKFIGESPILIHAGKRKTTFFTYWKNIPYLRAFPRDSFKYPKFVDIKLENANFKILSSTPFEFRYGWVIAGMQKVQICVLAHNLTSDSVKLNLINSNFAMGFNCGGYSLKLKNDKSIPPHDSIWICDSDVIYAPLFDRMCFYVGSVIGAIDSNESNDQICFFTTVTHEFIQSTDIKIFPNPAHQRITILTDAKISTFSIIDILGRPIRSGVFLEDHPIDLSTISSGSYFILLKGNKGVSSKKFIVQH